MIRTEYFACENCKGQVPYEIVQEYQQSNVRAGNRMGGPGRSQDSLMSRFVLCPSSAQYKLIKLGRGGELIKTRVK